MFEGPPRPGQLISTLKSTKGYGIRWFVFLRLPLLQLAISQPFSVTTPSIMSSALTTLTQALSSAPKCAIGCLNNNSGNVVVSSTTTALVCLLPTLSTTGAGTLLSSCIASACAGADLQSLFGWETENAAALRAVCPGLPLQASPSVTSVPSSIPTTSPTLPPTVSSRATSAATFGSAATSAAGPEYDPSQIADAPDVLVPVFAAIGGGLALIAILVIAFYCIWHRKREAAIEQIRAANANRNSRRVSDYIAADKIVELDEVRELNPASDEVDLPEIVIDSQPLDVAVSTDEYAREGRVQSIGPVSFASSKRVSHVSSKRVSFMAASHRQEDESEEEKDE